MNNDKKAQAKIIILHIVSDVPGVTYHYLMEKCLDSLTMDFFLFSDCLKELASSNLLSIMSETDGTGAVTADSSETIVYITNSGSAVLEDLKQALPTSTKNYLKDTKEELTNAMNLRNRIRSCVEVVDDSVFATLTINDEKDMCFKTQIKCNSQEEAAFLCSKWRKKALAAKDSFLSILNQ